MNTLRISAAALIIGFSGYAGAALAKQTASPPAQTTTDSFSTAPAPVQDSAAQPTPDPAPQADSATSSASPTSATAPDEASATDPNATAPNPTTNAKSGKKHKQHPTDQPSPDAPKPD